MNASIPVETPLDYLPLWGALAVTVGLMLLAVEVGFLLGHRKRQRVKRGQEGPVGEVVAGMLGLLAFLLAFMFGGAASRLETRKGLVVQEANALGTTWLRAGMVAEPHRTEVRHLLRDYLEVRLAAVQSRDFQPAVARSEELHQRLWAQAVALGQEQPNSIVVGLFISSLNEVIDLHTKRVAFGLRNRLPVSIWLALYFVALVAIGGIGYHAGLDGARRFWAILPLVLTFAVVMLVIVDLDRPQEGLLKTSQQSLTDLRALMAEQNRGQAKLFPLRP